MGTGDLGVFPFGAANSVRPARLPIGPAQAAVVGVYPSAFHVHWAAPAHARNRGAKGRVAALAVDVEPEVFWDGNRSGYDAKVTAWKSKVGFIDGDGAGAHGHIAAQPPTANGSSGAKVAARYLDPLNIDASRVGFTDVYPVFVLKHNAKPKSGTRQQGDAIEQEYNAIAHRLGKPPCTLPRRPATSALPRLAAKQYGDRIVADLERIDPLLLITLGAEVWHTLQLLEQLDARPPTSAFNDLYGDPYGSRGTIALNGRRIDWLPRSTPVSSAANAICAAASPRNAKRRRLEPTTPPMGGQRRSHQLELS